MIGGKNTKVANPRIECDYLRDCMTLRKIIFVSGHATLGAPTGTGRIDDGSNIGTLAGDKRRFTEALEIFPALGPAKSRVGRGLGNQDGFGVDCRRATGGSGELPPNRILGYQKGGVGVTNQLPLLVGGELVVEGNHHAAAVEKIGRAHV